MKILVLVIMDNRKTSLVVIDRDVTIDHRK